jgi:hypothetical protein
MAFGDTDISLLAVRNEIGSVSYTVAGVVGDDGLNLYSRYAPGTLSVSGTDPNTNIILTPPTTDFRLGDFRRYDHEAVAPEWWDIGDQYWGPGGSTKTITQPIAMNTLNLEEVSGSNNVIFDSGGTHYYRARFDVYGSEANRTNQTSLLKSWYPGHTNDLDEVAMFDYSASKLAGHTRDTDWVMNTGESGNLFELTDVPVSSPSCDRYFDAYWCDVSGNRKINFGEARSNGYVTVHFIENVDPYINCQNNNIPTPPSGYTAIFPQIYSSSTPVCSSTSNLDQTVESTSYDFYLFARGVYGSEHGIVERTNVTAKITLNSVDTTVCSGVTLSHTAGYHCTGTLAGSASWEYNDIATLTFVSATVASTPNYTTC